MRYKNMNDFVSRIRNAESLMLTIRMFRPSTQTPELSQIFWQSLPIVLSLRNFEIKQFFSILPSIQITGHKGIFSLGLSRWEPHFGNSLSHRILNFTGILQYMDSPYCVFKSQTTGLVLPLSKMAFSIGEATSLGMECFASSMCPLYVEWTS